jgi:predicted MPP superfamily phosphohydrolase
MKLSRRKWLGRSLFYGSGFAGFGYGSLVEKRWLDVARHHIPLTESHAALEGLKIAVMGDFHHDDFGDEELIGRAVKVINDEQVDLVYLVGDYISRDAAAIVPLCEVLRDLRPTLGTFGVMGNHDAWHLAPVLLETLENAGVRMLINDAQEFAHFGVVGMDSFWGGRPDLPFALNKITAGKPVILGWHEPDTFATYDDPRIVLQVSGHTHGGQICAPFYGPILLPEHGRKYPYGHYRRGDSSLFVTRGIGTLTLPARFFCPPEVVLLKFGVA